MSVYILAFGELITQRIPQPLSVTLGALRPQLVNHVVWDGAGNVCQVAAFRAIVNRDVLIESDAVIIWMPLRAAVTAFRRFHALCCAGPDLTVYRVLCGNRQAVPPQHAPCVAVLCVRVMDSYTCQPCHMMSAGSMKCKDVNAPFGAMFVLTPYVTRRQCMGLFGYICHQVAHWRVTRFDNLQT